MWASILECNKWLVRSCKQILVVAQKCSVFGPLFFWIEVQSPGVEVALHKPSLLSVEVLGTAGNSSCLRKASTLTVVLCLSTVLLRLGHILDVLLDMSPLSWLLFGEKAASLQHGLATAGLQKATEETCRQPSFLEALCQDPVVHRPLAPQEKCY